MSAEEARRAARRGPAEAEPAGAGGRPHRRAARLSMKKRRAVDRSSRRTRSRSLERGTVERDRLDIERVRAPAPRQRGGTSTSRRPAACRGRPAGARGRARQPERARPRCATRARGRRAAAGDGRTTPPSPTTRRRESAERKGRSARRRRRRRRTARESGSQPTRVAARTLRGVRWGPSSAGAKVPFGASAFSLLGAQLPRAGAQALLTRPSEPEAPVADDRGRAEDGVSFPVLTPSVEPHWFPRLGDHIELLGQLEAEVQRLQERACPAPPPIGKEKLAEDDATPRQRTRKRRRTTSTTTGRAGRRRVRQLSACHATGTNRREHRLDGAPFRARRRSTAAVDRISVSA